MRGSDRDYIIAFSCLLKTGPARFVKLRSAFSSLEQAWNAHSSALLEAGLPQDAIDELVELRSRFDLHVLLARLAKGNISVVTVDDDNYPEPLRHIHHAPYILYYRGVLPLNWFNTIGVVGTRNPSPYGILVAPQLTKGLAQAGMIIASGLALGIDTLAHEGTLSVGGTTVAVIGSGVDEESIYPSQNKLLARKIIEQGGCVMSEYPPGMSARKEHFPARNRIISGLSRGVLVVEAQRRSGALITAYSALEQNKDVFAVPGPITSSSSDGPNDLLKRGAVVVTEFQDILSYYSIGVAGDNKLNI